MIPNTRKTLLTAATMAAAALTIGVSSTRAQAPVKLLVEGHYGANVNATTGGNYCTVASGDMCQAGMISTIPGGFGEFSPWDIAVNNNPAGPSHGNIFITDTPNERVQELTPTGAFVLMFGEDVNETTGGNICTQEEIETKGVKCKAGIGGAEAGAFESPVAIAIDPVGGNVYVQDIANHRVEEFTEAGQFVLMIGREVNETKIDAVKAKGGTPTPAELEEENLCTAVSGNACKAGQASVGSTEHGAFSFGIGPILAAGGPNDLLYVGDERRVQEFSPAGVWVHDLSLASIPSTNVEPTVQSIALNQTSGDVYLTYQQVANTIFRFDATGEQIDEFIQKPREANTSIYVNGIALDSSGRLAVTESEEGAGTEGGGDTTKYFGSLLDGETGKTITQFVVAPDVSGNFNQGLAFSAGAVGSGEGFYATSERDHELVGYIPKEVAELVPGSLVCAEEGEHETSVALDCELTGHVDPENVAGTETWFLWSATEEGLSGPDTHETPRQPIVTGNTLVSVPAGMLAGQRPNERVHYEMAGRDEVVQPPERLTSNELSAITPLVAPKIVSAPTVSFVKPFSAVMFGELNPENASTEYHFEYGQGEALTSCPQGIGKESCPGVESTASAQSAAYGKLATTLEASGLQPATVYRYRLVAENENTAETERRSSLETPNPEDEGSFTTAPAPVPQAVTGQASAIGTTSATISGTVNPSGQPATYSFELGVYNGAQTQYGTVFSGSAGTGSVPVGRDLAVTGLQPGTIYAYRIFVQSGYGKQWGQTMSFTTAGVPTVLVAPPVLAQVPVPSISFPAVTAAGSVARSTTKALTDSQKLARALRACKKKSKKQRAACERQARKKYAKSKQANDRKKG